MEFSLKGDIHNIDLIEYVSKNDTGRVLIAGTID